MQYRYEEDDEGPGVLELVGRDRYVVFGYNNQRRTLRRCRRKLLDSTGISCEDAPEADSFYAWVEPTLVNDFYRQVRRYKLRATEAPEGATLASVIADFRWREKEEFAMLQQMQVQQVQIEGQEQEDEEMRTPEHLEETMLEALGIAQQEEQDNEESVDESVSVRVNGVIVTLQTLEELAARGTKGEAAAALGVSNRTFYEKVLGVLPGGNNLEFSYYCRKEDCLEKGLCFGRGDEAAKKLRAHAARNHRRPVPQESVVEPSEEQQEAGVSPLAERILKLEVRASEWTAVQEEMRGLETRLVQLEEEISATRARLEELETANPEARQAAERLARIRELLGE